MKTCLLGVVAVIVAVIFSPIIILSALLYVVGLLIWAIGNEAKDILNYCKKKH
jgi:Flp pilus assembly protein TadB